MDLNRKDLGAHICKLAKARDLDVIALAESSGDPYEIVAGLNKLGIGQYELISIQLGRFQVFSRLCNDFTRPRFDASRCSVLTFALPGIPVFNLMLLHAGSLLYQSSQSVALEIVELARTLREIEAEDGHSNSVVVGDFNSNPFGEGLVAANGFHAIMDAREALKGGKVIKNVSWSYFYNPMWSFLGDLSKGPPGTFYHRGSGLLEQQWHMLDQVIVRPSLLNHFKAKSVEIVAEIAGVKLTNQGMRPLKAVFSDHLPIYFEINM